MKVPRDGRRRTLRRLALATAAALCAISILGCSGSSDRRLSPKALAAKADVICKHLKEMLVASDGEVGGVTLPDRARLSVLFAAAEARGSNELAALVPREASAEREWQHAIAKRRGLIAYHHLMTKYASRGEAGPLEATYRAYKTAQWQMQLTFKHTRFPLKLCWDIG